MRREGYIQHFGIRVPSSSWNLTMILRLLPLLMTLPLCALAQENPVGDFGGLHFGRLSQDLGNLRDSAPQLASMEENPWQWGFHAFNHTGAGIVGFKGDVGWQSRDYDLYDIKRFDADLFLHLGKAGDLGSMYHIWGSVGVGWMHSQFLLVQEPVRASWNDALDGSYTQSRLSLAGPAYEGCLGADMRTQLPNMDTGSWLTLGVLVSWKGHFSKDTWKINGDSELAEAPEADMGGLALLLTLGYRY